MSSEDRSPSEVWGDPRNSLPESHGSTNRSSGFWTTKPCVTVAENLSPASLPMVLKDALNLFSLSAPDIVLTFISGTKLFSSWKNEDHRAALQKGIIKIINACETWIIDSGLDYGMSRMIGNAVRDEQRYRKARREYELFAKGHLQRRRYPVVLMGVTPTVHLNSTKFGFHDTSPEEQFENLGVDPSHTHFVFVDGPEGQTGARQANIVAELVDQAHHVLIRKNGTLKPPSDKLVKHEEVPLIAVLVQGDETAPDMVEAYLKKGIPVLVVKGTGLVADIMAFAFEECRDRDTGRHLEKIRADITELVMRYFPATKTDEAALVRLCGKIINCITLAKETKKELMSLVASSDSLSDLDHLLLPIIIAARSKPLNFLPHQIMGDFLLTMKLNRPEIAKSKVLTRDIDSVCLTNNDLFEKALLWTGREAFVEEFMEEDFPVHKFMSHSSLLRLFRLADNRDFLTNLLVDLFPSRDFTSVTFDESLVTIDLNLIIEQLSLYPDFLSMHELSSNYFGIYTQDAHVAERKAMNALMVWAVLMNRMALVQTLLKFCDDPIPMALFISALYRGLAKHADESMSETLNSQGRMFSTMAIDVLDMSYRESSERTFDLLNQKFTDFNRKTPIKMAYESENKYFLAHEACQIWLNRLWEGGIMVYGSSDALIPPEAKLVLSALFLFPINIWIQYTGKEFAKHRLKYPLEDAEGSLTEEMKLLLDDPIALMLHEINQQTDLLDVSSAEHNEKSEVTIKTLEELSRLEAKLKADRSFRPLNIPRKRANPASLYGRKTRPLPFWRKVYYLWSAPRTKFWMFQLFYWAYLAMYSVAIMLPSCNETHLDTVIFFWTLFSVIEVGLRTAYQARHDFPVSIRRRSSEVVLISVLVLLAIILRNYFSLVRPRYTRALFATGLLYMYYRMISVFFPMNPDLGPTLYRIKRMILVDFVSFVRLALPFILGNLFVLQAVMYPDLPFSVETLRQGFFRAFFTLFTAFIQEIDYTPRCEATRIFNRTDVCWTGDYADYTCPTLGVISYVLNIQYWIIVRLILMVLLSALFAATMIKVKEDSEYIFKYQRYSTVLDFASRSALPPPLSVFGYMFDWIVACCWKTKRIDKTHQQNLTNPRSMKLINKRSAVIRSNESYSYWMGLTKEYYRKKAEDDKQKSGKEQMTKLEFMTFDLLV